MREGEEGGAVAMSCAGSWEVGGFSPVPWLPDKLASGEGEEVPVSPKRSGVPSSGYQG